MRFWVKILSKSAETLGRKGEYILPKKAGLPAGVGGAPGALRPKVASELPTRRVHTPPSRERNPSSPPAQPPDVLSQEPQAEVLPLEPGGHLGRVPLADALGV